MATGKPDSRETHITRIFGTNKKGERLEDMWVDVERIDIVKGVTQVPPHMQWQGFQRRFRWCDDPDADNYNPEGTPSRRTEIVKVCDPTSNDVDDPDEWVPIRVIMALRPRIETGTENQGGTAQERFLSYDHATTSRIVEVRKIVHCDTNVDAEIEAAAAANPNLLEYVVPSESYTKNESTRDADQFVDHEIITYLKHRGNAGELSGLGRQTKMLNEYLLDDSDAPSGKKIGTFGFNPPYRLDPYQNIVNVKWNTIDQQWVLGISSAAFLAGFNEYGSIDSISAEGREWTGKVAGASGLGFTVVSQGPIAFGSVKTPAGGKRGAFLRADANAGFDAVSVYLGTLSTIGELSWQSVWAAPGKVLAISYANDKFFITYLNGDTSPAVSRIAVTDDGETFIDGINPFAGVPAAETGGQNNLAGNVAYNKKSKTYAIVGSHFNDDESAFNVGMCWGYSTDGLAWTSGYTSTPLEQPGGTLWMHFSTVAAGNGVFVAAGNVRHEFEKSIGDEMVNYVLHSCGIATSVNGSTWTVQELPDAVVRSSVDLGDREGQTTAVAFIEDKQFRDPKNEITGYFVAAGWEHGGSELTNTSKLWKGSPQGGWSIIQTDSSAVSGDQAFYVTLSAIAKKLPADPGKIISV